MGFLRYWRDRAKESFVKARVITEAAVFGALVLTGIIVLEFPRFPAEKTVSGILLTVFGAVLIIEICFISPYRHAQELTREIAIEHDAKIALEHKLTPRLSVSIDPARSIAHAWWDGGKSMKTFFRVIVSSLSPLGVENATGYLVSIEKDLKIVWDSEDVALTFSRGEDSDTLCKKIDAGGKYPLDVVVIGHDDNRLFLGTLNRTWPCFKSVEEIFSMRGEYILNLRVSAKDCPPVSAKVKFKWTGNVNTCEIGLIDEHGSTVSYIMPVSPAILGPND
jgi:hypothetical protein